MADGTSLSSGWSIIDTAIKIGLGALISGVTTYVVSAQSHKSSMLKAAVDDASALLKEGALKLEKSSSELNNAIHAYDAAAARGGTRSELKDAATVAISAYNEAKDAKALFFLINAPELAATVMPYLEAVEAVREELTDQSKGAALNPKALETSAEKARSARTTMLQCLGKTYEVIRGRQK